MTTDTCSPDTTGSQHAKVVRVAECVCHLAEEAWAYVGEHRTAIDQHWVQAVTSNPSYFDGIVLLTSACRLDTANGGPTSIALTLFETRFRNFLYWRHHGFDGKGVIDAFGTAIIRAGDGAILLVRQRPGNVNVGFYNFPCGFIDRRDIGKDGQVDIAANICREVAEEVGLGPDDLDRRPGFLITRVGVHLAIGIEFRSRLPADTLAARIRAFLATEANPEIGEVIFVRSRHEYAHLELAPHCTQFLPALL